MAGRGPIPRIGGSLPQRHAGAVGGMPHSEGRMRAIGRAQARNPSSGDGSAEATKVHAKFTKGSAGGGCATQ